MSTLISVEEAALLLNKSVATVRRMCVAGELTAEKVGRVWVIDARDPVVMRRVDRVLEVAEGLGIDLEKVYLRTREEFTDVERALIEAGSTPANRAARERQIRTDKARLRTRSPKERAEFAVNDINDETGQRGD